MAEDNLVDIPAAFVYMSGLSACKAGLAGIAPNALLAPRGAAALRARSACPPAPRAPPTAAPVRAPPNL